jgi:hypothetical protein
MRVETLFTNISTLVTPLGDVKRGEEMSELFKKVKSLGLENKKTGKAKQKK